MSELNSIRVMVVDDHMVVRNGIKFSLLAFDDIELVAEVDNGEDAVRLCGELRPDVVLMDLVMPGMDGVAATRAICERYQHVRVIALTSFQERELVREALQAGAISYLLKNVSAEDLAAAIREAHAGRSTLAPEAIQVLIQMESRDASYDQDLSEAFGLTSREQEVLALVVEGMSNPEIAACLVVSRSTAKAHVSNILSKLGVSNRAEAIAMALQHNMGKEAWSSRIPARPED